METKEIPYKCHVFVCVKSRNGQRKSCGDGGNPELKIALKSEARKRNWKGIVRISESNCLGVCESGPNIMIYPQKIWYSEVTPADLPEILQTLEKIIRE